LYREREGTLDAVQKALEELMQEPLGALIPEVRSNLGYALPGAAGYEEIAAVPGRISQVGERVIACRNPAFGASRHIARVIMAAMTHDPDMRSAINIKYSPEILDACRSAGFRIASFDRRDEPRDVKEREGSTLEWGTRRALQDAGEFPDLICDEGDVGKEPMIRVLGHSPREVVDKVARIAKACGHMKA
jgi:hydroxymethylpyrimidine/phosphomethylpyrimidine kinase